MFFSLHFSSFLYFFSYQLLGGGLADWYPTYLLRYTNATIDQAGLVVGAATVIGGIGGNILGQISITIGSPFN